MKIRIIWNILVVGNESLSNHTSWSISYKQTVFIVCKNETLFIFRNSIELTIQLVLQNGLNYYYVS